MASGGPLYPLASRWIAASALNGEPIEPHSITSIVAGLAEAGAAFIMSHGVIATSSKARIGTAPTYTL